MHIRCTQGRENDIVPIQYQGNKVEMSRDVNAILCAKETLTCL